MDVMRRLLLVLVLSTVVQAQVQLPATNTGSLSATGSVPLNVSGYASVAFQLTGTWSATVTFEGSVDGVTFQTINVTPTNSSSSVTTASANGVWVGSVGGLKYVRARVSAYTSGTVVATIQTALSGGGSGGGGGGGSSPSGTIGAAVPSTASPAGFKDASGNLAYVTLDGSGNVPVAVTGAGSGGTSSVDGSAYTAGTTAGTPLMGARDDAGTTACAEDKNCIARLTSARALMVDASATTQPVSGTFWQATQPVSGTFWQATQPVSGTFWQATQPVSGTVTANMGTVTADPFGANADAASATGSISAKLRFIASTGIPVTNAGTFPTQSAITAASGSIASGAIASGAIASGAIASGAIASGAVASGAYGSDSGSFGVGATGAAPPAKGNFMTGLGAGATGGFLVGVPVCDSVKAVSMTSATTTLMVTGVSGRHVRICSVHLVTAIANNVAFLSGTGATCGTGTAGMAGGTTAANGYNFAANGGLALGSGIGTVMQTIATGDSVCLVTSAAGPLAGTIAYTIY